MTVEFWIWIWPYFVKVSASANSVVALDGVQSPAPRWRAISPQPAPFGPQGVDQFVHALDSLGKLPRRRGHPINHHVAGAIAHAPRTQVRLAAHAPSGPPRGHPAQKGPAT